MSIVCAIKDAGGVWIGSDTECLNGYMRELVGPKWTRCGRWWIGFAGKYRGQNLIEANADRIAALPNVITVIDVVNQLIIDDKWKPREEPGEPLAWTCEFIITDGAEIISVSGDMSFTRQPVRTAIGTGAEAALGAFEALRGAAPREVIPIMVRSAVTIAKGCGGEPWYHFVPKPQETEHGKKEGYTGSPGADGSDTAPDPAPI